MTHPGDNVVLYLFIGVIFYLIIKKWNLFSSTRNWLTTSSSKPVAEIKGIIPELLRNHGYEVYKSKTKVPINMFFNDKPLESRLFVDYIVKQDNDWYIVIVARERKPLKASGPGVRDFFLPYYLLYRPTGILYVDANKQLITQIDMEIDDCLLNRKWNRNLFYLLIIGIIIGFMIAQWVTN